MLPQPHHLARTVALFMPAVMTNYNRVADSAMQQSKDRFANQHRRPGGIPRLWLIAAVVFALIVVLGVVMWHSVLQREEHRAIERRRSLLH